MTYGIMIKYDLQHNVNARIGKDNNADANSSLASNQRLTSFLGLMDSQYSFKVLQAEIRVGAAVSDEWDGLPS